jgi:glutamyl-tRNA synthetase
MSSSVKTRFAPSPTGFLHVGGMRTALFAWLVAKQASGEFILRIEDTDQARKVDGADMHILESLGWLGLNPDEGPIYQSERVEQNIYKKWAEKLIEKGRAYADPYSATEVQAFREEAHKNKQPFLYRNHRPDNPPKWDGTTPLRFKSDPKDCIAKDAVMGGLKTGPEVIDDFILIKSDGFPTYNFAHIVDDIEMGVTHVIRGQEFLASLPNYQNLYEALGEKPPVFATVPHILNEQGNKKLSKRDGAKDVLYYAKEGFLPEALLSFIATLGWNDGTEQEFFSREELIKKFSLDRVGKSGAHFDEKRLKWINGHFIRESSIDKLLKDVENYWPKTASIHGGEYKKQVLEIVQERLKYLAELPELTSFFFEEPNINPALIQSDKKLKKSQSEFLKYWLEATQKELSKIDDWSAQKIQYVLNDLLEKTSTKPATLFSLIRIAVTQAPASPGLAETLEVLGQERSLQRLTKQIQALK